MQMSKESGSPIIKGSFRLERCTALTDGVFAIVVTLLVLGIELPSDHNFSEDGLYKFLERISFELMLYAISFSRRIGRACLLSVPTLAKNSVLSYAVSVRCIQLDSSRP
jgi:hypothetical protein